MKKIIFFISTIIFSSNFSMAHLPGEQSNDTDPNSNQEIIDIQSTDSNSNDSSEIEEIDIHGNTLLHKLCFASMQQNIYFGNIKILVEKKRVNVNALNDENKTPIHYIYIKEIVLYLLSKGADVNQLNNYAKRYLDDIDYILEMSGIDINAQDENGDTALHKYIGNYDLEKIEKLLNLGANPNIRNTKGETPITRYFLSDYFYPNDLEIKRLYLLAKHSTDFCIQDNNKNDIYSIILNTFLNRMLYYKDDFKKFANCLIEIGFSPDKKDAQGKILLHELCKISLDFFEFIKMLVDEKNADVNAIDGNGKTPLYYTYDKEIAKYLISKGADADSLNRNGQKWSDILN